MALVKVTYKQVATFVNNATKEALGESALLAEDLTNVVDIGVSIQNADLYETLVDGLLVAIGKEIYVNRPYKSSVPDVIRDNVEWGQLVTKTRGALDDAQDNQSWSLVDGSSYDDNQFIENEVSTKIFKNRTAYEIRKSITNEQIKAAFRNAEELTKFVSMIFTMVYNSLEVKRASLVMRTINNFIGEVRYNNKTTQNVKLLTAYNTLTSQSLTADEALCDKGFIRYAIAVIKRYKKYMAEYSTLFNVTGTQTFTPEELQHLVLLDEFAQNAFTYLESDTFHNEFVEMPYGETVPYWQGTGTALGETRDIKLSKTASGNAVSISGIIAILFDHDALGVMEDSPTITTHEVKSAEFTNYWFKQKTGYFNDLDENFILFTLE